jgi:N,N'-diacetyllegionaminate synthase
MKIGNKIISNNHYPFIIAEVGLNHNGSLKIAKKLIDCAVSAGCDAVKFQTIKIDKLLLNNTPLANYQKKNKSKNMYDLIKKNNLTFDQFLNLEKYCKFKKITFLSTPFDEESAIFLKRLNIPAFKISSGDNDNFLLLSLIKKFKKPIILSTGMSTTSEVKKTINFLKLKRDKLAILHCISDYPTSIDETQLFNINLLKKFGYNIGFSDHTIGKLSSSVAVGLGANIIEKHITLDNNMKGPDHQMSLPTSKLKDFVQELKSIKKSFFKKERTLTTKEKLTKKVAKKSLYFKSNLKKNHRIKVFDLISLRPTNNGISPSEYKFFINKILKKDVMKYQILKRKNFK